MFEVGYQIGCGIDMSTSNGVSLTGTAGINPSIGVFGIDFADAAAGRASCPASAPTSAAASPSASNPASSTSSR